MQKTIIAAAIIGLVSAGASAVTLYDKDGTKVGLTGKFDLAFQRSTADTAAGKLDSYQILDGKWSTSRLAFSGESAITSDLTAYLGYDLRFNNVFTGKTAPDGGASSNDAMKGGIVSKKFGKIEAGTINVAAQQFVYKKNYVNKSESEIVKYGVSSMGLESLSNRNVYLSTTKELPVAAKFSYAFSDESASRTAAQPDKAPLWSAGIEGSLLNNSLTFGMSTTIKESSDNTSFAKSNRIQHNESYIAFEKNYAKINFFTSYDKADLGGTAKKGTGYGLNVYYLVGDKIDLGLGFQKYTDQSDIKNVSNNNGRGYMAGVHYYATKEVTFFAGTRYDGWDRNETLAGAKIVGNAAAFTGDMKKNFSRTYFTGMNYTF